MEMLAGLLVQSLQSWSAERRTEKKIVEIFLLLVSTRVAEQVSTSTCTTWLWVETVSHGPRTARAASMDVHGGAASPVIEDEVLVGHVLSRVRRVASATDARTCHSRVSHHDHRRHDGSLCTRIPPHRLASYAAARAAAATRRTRLRKWTSSMRTPAR